MASSRSIELFVPGRVCLLGEHSDWAGTYRRFNSDVVEGYALVSGTRQGLFARVQPHPSKLVVSSVLNDGSTVNFEIAMDPDELLKNAAQGGFWSYCCGVAYEIATNYQVRGLIIENYKTDLPIKKGLSSSAALCVLVTRAFNRVYDLKLNVRGEMDIAYRGEIRTPSRCGRLDQCCAFGQAVVSMSFDADSLGTREVATKEEIFLVLVDLHGQKDTKEILKCLNKCFPFPSTEVEKGVHELLGPLNKQTVLEAMRVLENGVDTAKQLGALMSKAQANFDKFAIPACPHELTAPILHKVLSYGPIQQHIWGGKGVGSQGDGTAQFVAKSKEDQLKLMQILEKDLKVSCLELTLGARRIIRKAVIPCAGYGKGMFPASKCVKAPMFPIIDRDGIMKPAILIIVEEALAAGVEEVAIVVQPHDLADFRALFHEPLPPENFNTLSTAHQAYAKKLEEVGRHVKLITQESQLGFGHAVYCAREFVGKDHFLLLLGDHLYRSKEQRSCAKQLIEAYERTGQSVVALQWVAEGLISEVGVVSGMAHKASESKDADQVVLDVTEVAEKPPVDYAREKLRVSLPSAPSANHFLGVFGQYVLDPQIFTLLADAIERNLHERNGGIGLSLSLERLRKESRLLGVISNGDRFDLGMPQHYLHTLSHFHLPHTNDAR